MSGRRCGPLTACLCVQRAAGGWVRPTWPWLNLPVGHLLQGLLLAGGSGEGRTSQRVSGRSHPEPGWLYTTSFSQLPGHSPCPCQPPHTGGGPLQPYPHPQVPPPQIRVLGALWYRMADNPEDVSLWVLESIFPRVILLAVVGPRQGDAYSQARAVRERLRRWRLGEYGELWDEAPEAFRLPPRAKRGRAGGADEKTLQEKNGERAAKIAQEGQYGKALQTSPGGSSSPPLPQCLPRPAPRPASGAPLTWSPCQRIPWTGVCSGSGSPGSSSWEHHWAPHSSSVRHWSRKWRRCGRSPVSCPLSRTPTPSRPPALLPGAPQADVQPAHCRHHQPPAAP